MRSSSPLHEQPRRLGRLGPTFRRLQRLPLRRVHGGARWRVHHRRERLHGMWDAVDAAGRVEISAGHLASSATDNVVERSRHVAALRRRVEVVDRRRDGEVVHGLRHVRRRRGGPRRCSLHDVRRLARESRRVVFVAVLARSLRGIGLGAGGGGAGAGLVGRGVEAEEVVGDLGDDRRGLGSAALDGVRRGGVERVDEPLVGGCGLAGGAREDGAEGGVGRGREEEDAEAGRPGEGGVLVVDAVELVKEVVDVVVGGDGDERVEVVLGQLVLERRPGHAVGEEGRGDLGERGDEGGVGGRGPREGDDAGLPADVAQLAVPRARQDAAAEAAHEAHLRAPMRRMRGRSGGGGRGGRREGRRVEVVGAAVAVAGPGARGGGRRGRVRVVRGRRRHGGRRRARRKGGGVSGGGGRRWKRGAEADAEVLVARPHRDLGIANCEEGREGTRRQAAEEARRG
ncbi:unnamed protein product [Urochloa humidicola]